MKTTNFNNPDLINLLQILKSNIFATLNCVQIGTVQEVDLDNQTVQVELQIKRIKNISDSGVVTYSDPAKYPLTCPFFVLFGGQGGITFPITQGDNCLVLFNDQEIDQWFANGGMQVPISQRAHDVADAIALIGINNLQSLIQNYFASGIRLFLGDSVKIELSTDLIASLATLFTHTGNMEVTGDVQVQGNLEVEGNLSGTGGTITATDIITSPQIKSGNGATGSGTHVTVVNGIVTAVS